MTGSKFLRAAIEKARQAGKFRTRAELAKLAGVNQGNLSSFLRGSRQSINFETAWSLMQFLGILPGEQQTSRPSDAPLLSSQSPSENELRQKVEYLQNENALLRELLATQKELRALEKNTTPEQDTMLSGGDVQHPLRQ